MKGKLLYETKLYVIKLIIKYYNSDEKDKLIKDIIKFYSNSYDYLSRIIEYLSEVEGDFSSEFVDKFYKESIDLKKSILIYLTNKKNRVFYDYIKKNFDNLSDEVKPLAIKYLTCFCESSDVDFYLSYALSVDNFRIREAIFYMAFNVGFSNKGLKCLLKLKSLIFDEREWRGYINILKKYKNISDILKILPDLPAILRIDIYNWLDVQDYKLREFLWKRFYVEEQIAKFSLIQIIPLKSLSEVDRMYKSILKFHPIYIKKALGLLSNNKGKELVFNFFEKMVVDELIAIFVNKVKNISDDELLKEIVRWLRFGNSGEDLEKMILLFNRYVNNSYEKLFFKFFLKLKNIFIDRLIEVFEPALYCSDLPIFKFNKYIELILDFLITNDFNKSDLIFPFFYITSSENLKVSIVLYMIKNGLNMDINEIFSVLKYYNGYKIIKFLSINNINIKKYLIYNFSSFSKYTKIEILKLFSLNVGELLPIFKKSLYDKEKLVVKEALRILVRYPEYNDITKPFVYSNDKYINVLVGLNFLNDLSVKKIILKSLIELDDRDRKKILTFKDIVNLYGNEFLFVFFNLRYFKPDHKKLIEILTNNNLELFYKFINNNIFPEGIDNIRELLIFGYVLFLFSTYNLQDIEKEIKSFDKSEFLEQLYSKINLEKKNKFLMELEDILNGKLKSFYKIEFLSRSFELAPSKESIELLKGFPENRDILLFKIGSIYFELLNYKKALNYLEKVNSDKLIDENRFYFMKSYAYLRLGHISLAFPYAEKIDENVKNDKTCEYFYEIANELKNNDDYYGALYFYKKISKINIEYKDVSEKIKKIESYIKNKKDIQIDRERFHNVEEIGSGGMGKIFRAFDTRLKREVAIKVLSKKRIADLKNIKRFVIRDGIMVQRLKHKGIVKVFEVIKDAETPYIVMEYIKGKTLKEVIRTEKDMNIDTKLDIIIKIMDVVEYFHSEGIIHRDLKSDNIMLEYNGNIKIMDFALSKKIDTTTAVQIEDTFGTIYYMAPEQLRGENLDKSVDIYAVGVILYTMLSGGKYPFYGKNLEEVIYKILNEPVYPLSEYNKSAVIFEDIINKALDKDKSERFKSISEFKTCLLNIK